jgi:integrase
MGRPLTGSVRHHRNRWWAGVPNPGGGRREEGFGSEADARAWLAAALDAYRVGQSAPDTDRYRRTQARPAKRVAKPEPAKLAPDIASVSKAWMAAAYEDLRRGGPERADRVRRIVEAYLVPYFAPRTTTVADVTYQHCHDWLLSLVGRDQPAQHGVARSTTPVGDEEIGLAELAQAAGVSLPTARRRWRAGALPGAYRDHNGQVRVPASAVATVTNKRACRPEGLSQSYVADALWVLRRVLAFARANGLAPAGFDPTESLEAPSPDPARARRSRPTGQPRPLSLPECARIASHLHVVHQSGFWLQRIMGLRVSEAFGLQVGDVVDLGEVGLLAVQGQGGRRFKVRDDHGRLEVVPRKDTVKTAAGFRVLVVPERLMEVLRVVIEAFHTDPDTGQVDTAARLVPGIRVANQAGLMNYQTALADAAGAEGLCSADLGFPVTTHLLRKSCATDLAWATGIDDHVRRRFMGHRAGDDVYGRIYTLDHPDVAPLRQVAEILDANIEKTIGSLLVPTTRKIRWGPDNPLRARADHVGATLAAAGWHVEPGAPEDPLCPAERVAAELDIYVTTARRWMADGTLPTIVAPDDTGVPRRWVRLTDIWAHRDRLTGRLVLPDVAESLGLRYHEAYHLLRRLDLDLDQHPTTGEYKLTPEAVHAMRAETERIRDLHRRSVKLAAAARQLRMAASSVALMSRTGELEVDPETDSSGARFVTRASVERAWMARQERRKPRTAQAAVPVAEVARFTGHTSVELVDLVKAGVLQQVPGRGQLLLTAASLRAWMAEGGPGHAEPGTVAGGTAS